MASSRGNVTSFQKKQRGKGLNILGTRTSLHNNQLLISTGIPSLDNVIGGGLAVGTIMLIEEDTFSSYSHTVLKYFLAEGVVNKHHIFLASADVQPANILEELPGPIIDDPGKLDEDSSKDMDMKIAWRYKNMPQVQSSPVGPKYGHYYDMTKTIDSEMLANTEKTLLHVEEDVENKCSSCGQLLSPSYALVLRGIKDVIESGKFSTSIQTQQRNILRIGLHSLGSPLWGEEGGHNSHTNTPDPSLPRFLFALKSLLRSAFATCVLTMPTHLYHDKGFVSRIEHLCDTVIHLDSFMGSDKETNPAFKEYHGLFNIIKLPRLNSLTCHMPDTLDLAFKLKRKKFMIEKLHLPPELSETASRNQEDPVLPRAGAVGCGGATGGSSSKLDF